MYKNVVFCRTDDGREYEMLLLGHPGWWDEGYFITAKKNGRHYGTTDIKAAHDAMIRHFEDFETTPYAVRKNTRYAIRTPWKTGASWRIEDQEALLSAYKEGKAMVA